MNLYHYCSNVGFLGIIENREIRLGDLSLSNDSMEGRWLFKIIEDQCVKLKISEKTTKDVVSQVSRFATSVGGAGFCLSTHADMLSQWRGYADNGGGVCIGFDDVYLKELCESYGKNQPVRMQLVKVDYDEKKQGEQVAENLKRFIPLVEATYKPPNPFRTSSDAKAKDKSILDKAIKDMVFEAFSFLPFLFSFKNPGFSEEDEWRIFSYIVNVKSGNIDSLRYRALNDRIVPFMKIPLAKLGTPSIREIVIGPRCITPEKVIENILKANGFENVTVRRSGASYR